MLHGYTVNSVFARVVNNFFMFEPSIWTLLGRHAARRPPSQAQSGAAKENRNGFVLNREHRQRSACLGSINPTVFSESEKTTVQNMAEFWNASTRPLDKNGQGLSAERVKRRIAIVERLCEVISEDNTSYAEWKLLVEELGVSGVAVHDARLVSAMLRMGIREILTPNERDFNRYTTKGISVLTPELFLGLTS